MLFVICYLLFFSFINSLSFSIFPRRHPTAKNIAIILIVCVYFVARFKKTALFVSVSP